MGRFGHTVLRPASAAAADAGNSFFNRVLEKNGNGWLVGENITYADLALFHVVDGLSFAYVFPPACLPLPLPLGEGKPDAGWSDC